MILDAGTPQPTIPRDQWGRPRVPNPLNPTETLVCHRPSGVAKRFLTSTYALEQWSKRMVLKGAGLRPELAQQAAVLDVKEDRDVLQDLATQAMETAGSARKATIGTTIHAVLESILLGDPVEIPPDLQANIDAIRACLLYWGIEVVPGWVEAFVINADLPAAGSADAIVTLPGHDLPLIFDLKTGGDPRHYTRPLEYAVQAAIYANATHSWRGTGTDLIAMPEVDKTKALILWAPSEEPTAELIALDIAEGAKAAQLAMEVAQVRIRPRRLVLGLEGPSGAPERRETLRKRAQHLVQVTPLSVSDLVANWPLGVPKDPEADLSTRQLDAIEHYLAGLEDDMGVAFASLADPGLVEALNRLDKATADEILAYATESRGEVPAQLGELTDLEVIRATALAVFYADPTDDLETALVEALKNRRAVLAAGKTEAKTHSLPVPKSTAEVAQNPLLTALVLYTKHNQI